MNKPNTAEKHFPIKQRLALLHGLKLLLDEDDLPEDDRDALKTVLKNVLKKKSETGTVIHGIKPLLMRTAVAHFKSKKYKIVKSTLSLLQLGQGFK